MAFVSMRMSSLSTLGHTPLDSLGRRELGSSVEHDRSSKSEAARDMESSAASFKRDHPVRSRTGALIHMEEELREEQGLLKPVCSALCCFFLLALFEESICNRICNHATYEVTKIWMFKNEMCSLNY